jgi:hypothetical protein
MGAQRRGCLAAILLTIGLAVACGSDGAQNDGDTPARTRDPNGICVRPIAALTAEPVTAERLEAAITRMREVQSAAEAGGAQAANAAFVGDTHDITHDIDPPLRAVDPLLAQELCASILVIEQQLGTEPDLAVVAAEGEVAAGLLQDSGRALGLLD